MKSKRFERAPEECRATRAWAAGVLVLGLMIVGQLPLREKILGLITRDAAWTYPAMLCLIVGTFAMIAFLFVLCVRLFERRSLASAGVEFGMNTQRH